MYEEVDPATPLPRCAVCVSGSIRTLALPEVLETMKRELLDPLQADLFMNMNPELGFRLGTSITRDKTNMCGSLLANLSQIGLTPKEAVLSYLGIESMAAMVRHVDGFLQPISIRLHNCSEDLMGVTRDNSTQPYCLNASEMNSYLERYAGPCIRKDDVLTKKIAFGYNQVSSDTSILFNGLQPSWPS